MDIKELTERYQDHFNAHYLQDDNGAGRKGRKRKKEVETLNFFKDITRPILDVLPDLLPEYEFTEVTDDHAMYGEYCRIKADIVLVGGFSIDEDFNLYFTPLFHGEACGENRGIDSIGQLTEIIREQSERGEVKMKGQFHIIDTGRSVIYCIFVKRRKSVYVFRTKARQSNGLQALSCLADIRPNISI